MKRLATYGVLLGLIIAAWLYVEFLLGFHANEVGRYTGFVPFIITMIGLYLGIKAYRDLEKAGKINYWQTVFAGIKMSVFAGLICALFTFIYLSYINPSYADFIIEANSQLLKVKGATAENLQQNADFIRQRYQPMRQALGTFGGFVAASALFSFILGGILKSRRMTD